MYKQRKGEIAAANASASFLRALDPFQLPYAVRGFWTELLPLAFLGVAKPSGEVIFQTFQTLFLTSEQMNITTERITTRILVHAQALRALWLARHGGVVLPARRSKRSNCNWRRRARSLCFSFFVHPPLALAWWDVWSFWPGGLCGTKQAKQATRTRNTCMDVCMRACMHVVMIDR